MKSTTRRETLIVIAAAVSPPLGAQHQHAELTLHAAAAYKVKTLTSDEMAGVTRLCDLIIPRTETPGASDAGVPEFIDRRLTASPNLAATFRLGMARLDSVSTRRFGAKFIQLPSERQINILTSISNAPDTDLGRFFRLAKDLTIDGYYASHSGLVEELGWHGNTFLTEFKGCTHPEHQMQSTVQAAVQDTADSRADQPGQELRSVSGDF
jgi:hypothetical protein